MILCIKTNTPQAELYLYDNERNKLASYEWQAHKQLAETLHRAIVDQLQKQNASLDDLTGVVVYNGDGSFTGLRIGISVANALGYSLNIPVVSATSENWIHDGCSALQQGTLQRFVVPVYASPVFTNKQKR